MSCLRLVRLRCLEQHYHKLVMAADHRAGKREPTILSRKCGLRNIRNLDTRNSNSITIAWHPHSHANGQRADSSDRCNSNNSISYSIGRRPWLVNYLLVQPDHFLGFLSCANNCRDLDTPGDARHIFRPCKPTTTKDHEYRQRLFTLS